MPANDGNASSSTGSILFTAACLIIGCAILFGAETTALSIVGALLMAVGLWGLIR